MLRGATVISRNGAATIPGSRLMGSTKARNHRVSITRPSKLQITPRFSGSLDFRRVFVHKPAAGARAKAGDEESPDAHLISTQELSDGTLIFSFGTEEDVKSAQETPSANETPPKATKKKKAAKKAPKEVPAAHIEQEPAQAVEPEAPMMEDPEQRLAHLAEDIDRIDAQFVKKTLESSSAPQAHNKEPEVAAATKAPASKKNSQAKKAAEPAAGASKAAASKSPKGSAKAAPAKAAAPAASSLSAADLDSLKVPELRAMAKERSLRGYSKLKKAELIELLTV